MELRSYGADSIKQLVAFANDRNLNREDIVTILAEPTGGYVMVYFDID